MLGKILQLSDETVQGVKTKSDEIFCNVRYPRVPVRDPRVPRPISYWEYKGVPGVPNRDPRVPRLGSHWEPNESFWDTNLVNPVPHGNPLEYQSRGPQWFHNRTLDYIIQKGGIISIVINMVMPNGIPMKGPIKGSNLNRKKNIWH